MLPIFCATNPPQARRAYCLPTAPPHGKCPTIGRSYSEGMRGFPYCVFVSFVVDALCCGATRYNDRMIHEILPVGPLQCNCSVIGDETTHEAMVIDPGDDIEDILGLIRKHNLQVKQIVITHAHIDHVGGAMKLRAATGAPILLNQNDYALLKMLDAQAAWIGVRLQAKLKSTAASRPEKPLPPARSPPNPPYPRPHRRQHLPLLPCREKTHRRRHPLRRVHRPHRSPGRIDAENHCTPCTTRCWPCPMKL